MPKAKTIKPEEFYSPKEIVRMGIMNASNMDTRRQMLLRFIRQGRIPAKNIGGSKQPRYIVQGKHLIEYRNTAMKPGEYETK